MLKPIKMFVYQPFYTIGKDGKTKVYKNTKTHKIFPYFPVRKGDLFTGEKRITDFLEMQKHPTLKVVKVVYNYRDGTCNVVLSDTIIEPKIEPPEEPKTDETAV